MHFSSPPESGNYTRLKTVLGRIRHLEGLPDAVQAEIAAAAFPVPYKAGQVIYIEGEPAGFVYLLEQGWVKAVRMSSDGREQAMLFLQACELFGDIAVYTDQVYPGSVVALEDVQAWLIPADKFLKMVADNPSLALAMLRRMGERVLKYIGMVEDLALRSVESRLANTLLQHAEARAGRLVVPRRHWTTFDEMAVRLGTVRDVLSRTLRSLEAQELLRVEKQAIILLDPEGLRQRGDL